MNDSNRLPGFTAEQSLYETEEQYLLTTTEGSHASIGPAAVRGDVREAGGIHCFACICDPWCHDCIEVNCHHSA